MECRRNQCKYYNSVPLFDSQCTMARLGDKKIQFRFRTSCSVKTLILLFGMKFKRNSQCYTVPQCCVSGVAGI